jgi:type IV pilus assembly protein PilA
MPRAFHSRFRHRGFTWVELMMVIGVIAILGLMAVPALQDQALKRQVKEGLALADVAKKGVQAVYSATGDMPADNKAAGVPDRDKIIGTFVKDVAVLDGAITLTFGNNASKAIEDRKVTLRPAIVPGTPSVPISWLCHVLPVPAGMEARGKDETDIPPNWLPVECRARSAK